MEWLPQVLMNISENREDVTCGYVKATHTWAMGLYNRIFF